MTRSEPAKENQESVRARRVRRLAHTAWNGVARHPLELNTPGRSLVRAWTWGTAFGACVLWLDVVSGVLVWSSVRPWGREVLGTVVTVSAHLSVLLLSLALLMGVVGIMFGVWSNPRATSSHPRRPGRE